MSRDSYVNKLSPVIPSLAWPAVGLFLNFVQWAKPVRVEPTLRKGGTLQSGFISQMRQTQTSQRVPSALMPIFTSRTT
jgi:hypothetical protein